MALSPVLIAIVEPWIVGSSFAWRELIFGAAVVPGIVLIVGGTPAGMRSGIAVGILSAFFVSIFGSLNKRFVEEAGAFNITGLEMGAGAVSLALTAPFLPRKESAFVWPDPHDTVLLLTLALVCTLLPFALSLVAQRHLSAFATGLAVNMEPVYAIVLAILLFGEQHELSATFYLGVVIVFAVVFSYPFIAARREPESAR
jgi:drug/metabolite transporter (DMT)-like permease